MKKPFIALLSLAVLLEACGSKPTETSSQASVSVVEKVETSPKSEMTAEAAVKTEAAPSATEESNEVSAPAETTAEPATAQEYHVGNVLEDYGAIADPEEFYSLNDPELLNYVEDNVYDGLLTTLPENQFFVENVETKYISKEYLEELAYNSKENVFFGYTLSELDSQFMGRRYVFTLGEDGKTVVKAFDSYDATYEKALKNVAVGTGVILVCITVSSLTVSSAPAVSMILAVSAKTGAKMAVSSGAIASISSGIITGIETGDMEQALKAAAENGSEAFKWGAISGALAGGATEGIGLYGATANDLTMNQAAIIQRETKWPLDAIKNLHSMEEYDVYKRAGLVPIRINDNWAFVQNIDWDFVDDKGYTNLQRVLEQGNAPIGPDGQSYQLHHIGQHNDSPLAILTQTQHQMAGDTKAIHYQDIGRGENPNWSRQKQEFWESMARLFLKTRG